MFQRFLASAPLGLAVTVSLLYIMQLLVQIGPGPDLSPRENRDFHFVRAKVIEETLLDEPKPDRIDPPEPFPPIQPRNTDPANTKPIGVPLRPPPTPQAGPFKPPASLSDGPGVNVLKVSPNYPIAASRRGLEGWVIVRFDVSEIGTVENITIVDSSNSIFEKAATDAAARFRYKPQVIDGVAQPTRGFVNKFIFEMET